MLARVGLVLLAVAAISGCAKAPGSIAPAYVSTVPYESWNCQQLGEESARLGSALATASTQQEQARGNDVVGVLLIGLPVSSMSGDNIAPQIADLKGQQKAVQQTMSMKSCSGFAPGPPRVTKAPGTG